MKCRYLKRSMHHQVFESGACRVWTGALGTPLHAIENAQEHEIETFPFDVQVWLKHSPQTASGDGQSLKKGLYLVRTGAFRTHLQHLYSVWLPLDALSCFSIYSPSPFVSAVLVVLDVNEKQQQGYFFGRVQRAVLRSRSSGEVKQSSHQDKGVFDNTAEELLSALHIAFPRVELSISAKECLAKRTKARHVAGNKLSERVKRRKTLSADAFYGSNDRKVTAAGPADGSMSDNGWQSFYKALQFRVSHSMMCQLEGTAPISSSFPRQQEAFEFADQIVALQRRVKPSCSIASHSGHDSGDRVPRMFSFESAGDGKRRFLVASLAEFLKNYKKTRADQRHVYEVIREGVPCRLYLDLEFKRVINPLVNGDALVARLLSLLQLQFYRRYGICVHHQDIYQLDSSTSTKFSRHIIFHLPDGDLFTNNLHAGAFVREFINDLVVLGNDGSEDKGSNQPRSPFLINTETENDSDDKKQLFIDTGVYTRNRMFRVLGSSKFKKQAVLRSLDAPSSPPKELDQELFVNTLVCPYPTLEAAEVSQQTKSFRLLRCQSSSAVVRRNRRVALSSGRSLTTSSIECRSSVYPELDVFIRSQATTGGVQGEIRAIQMLMTSSSDVLATLPGKGSHHEQPMDSNRSRSYPWKIIYHMTRNRWCANIQRPHKSNNVMFVVDTDQRVFYQKCHDPVCQAMDFRSPPQPLPTCVDFGVEAVKTPK